MRILRLFQLSTVVASVMLALVAVGLALSRPAVQTARAATFTWPGAAPCDTTLQACIDAVLDGDQITIVPGTYTEGVSIQKAITLTSPSPTTTLQALPGQRVMGVSAPAANLGMTVYISNLTLVNGDVTAATGGCPVACGGGLLVYNQARVILDNVTIERNQATRGGGVYVDQATVILNSGRINNNHALIQGQGTASGGGVYVANAGSQFVQNGGEIRANTATDGAGVFVQDGQYAQNGGEIAQNNASNWGGGLLVANAGANAQLVAGRILTNTAGMMGGGILVDAGLASINSTVIAGNSVSTVPGWGGGIAVWQKSGRVLQGGGQVTDNTATLGGGYAIVSGTVVLGGNALVSNNRATQRGGGAYLEAEFATLTQLNGTIFNNIADSDGGGVTVLSGLYAQRAGDVISNSALNTGGGVSVDSGGNYQLWNGRVLSNTAAQGGGVSVLFGTAVMSGGVVVGNQASQGGGVFIAAGLLDVNNAGAITDNNASSGGGVFVQGGQFNLRGGKIARNVAGNGGGIYLQSAASGLIQTDGLIENNQSNGGSGGGLYVETGSALLTGGQYSRNTAYLQGGGIASVYGSLQLGGSLQILDNVVNPVSFGAGGGVAVMSGTATLSNGVIISGNRVNGAFTTYGGGLYAYAPIVITGVRFISNTSGFEGGGVYLGGVDEARVVNSLFARNSAVSGAAIASTTSGRVTVLHSTIGDVALNPAEAIYVTNLSMSITDTIVTSHSIGINVADGSITGDYNLFYNTPISIANGSMLPGLFNLDGADPLFVNSARDNYRLQSGSPAVNTGIDASVTKDLGGWPRPMGAGFDRGAFELQALGLPIGGNVTATLVYTSNTGTTTTVTLPPSLVTTATQMIFTNLVDQPEDAPPPNPLFKFAGSAFQIDAFGTAGAIPGITFTQPITIVIHYNDADLGGIQEGALRLYRYEHAPFGTGWCEIGVCRPNESQSVDIEHNVIVATVFGFSKWGKMGPEGGELYLPLILK